MLMEVREIKRSTEICPVGAALIRAGRQADVKLTGDFRNYANAS